VVIGEKIAANLRYCENERKMPVDDLYTNDNNLGTEPTSFEIADVLSLVKSIEAVVRNGSTKKCKAKKGGGKKKRKRQMRKLEAENAQLRMYLQTLATQMPKQQSAWWQDAIVKSLPKLIDLGGVILSKSKQK
jgi:hypothetical protein